MSCCSESTAKTGRVIRVHTEYIEAPSSAVSTGDCMTEKFIIDCAGTFPGGSGEILQVDLVELIDASGTKVNPDCILFLHNEDYTAQGVGDAFALAPADDELERIICMEKLSGAWDEIDTLTSIQLNKSLNLNFETGSGRMLFGQLVSLSGASFSSNTTLMLRLYIRKD